MIPFRYLEAEVGDFLISPEGKVYLILKKLSREHRAFRCLTMDGKIKITWYVHGPFEIAGRKADPNDPKNQGWHMKASK